MARPERKTVDYFPHYISDGKKMFFIEHKYGNNGYAVWYKLLESLACTENHFLDLNDTTNLMFLSAKCRVSEDELFLILEDLMKLGEIDHDLWLSKVVYSHKFIESIQDAYLRRSNKCMTYEGLCNHLLGLCIHKLHQNAKNEYNKPQSKVKESKLNETKEKESKEIELKKEKIPSEDEFIFYAKTIPEFSSQFDSLIFSLKSKYESWISNGWKDGNGTPIKNWKVKLKNTMPFLKPIYNNQNGKSNSTPINRDQQIAEYTARVLAGNKQPTDSERPNSNGENGNNDFATFEIV